MPKTLDRPTVLEGTWEEVAKEAGDLAGKRVALTIYPEAPGDTKAPETSGEAPRNLAEWLAPLLEEADRLTPEPPVPATDPHEIAFGEIMRKKAERLGLKT